MELSTKARLWEKLLARPDDLTDLRIILAEYILTKSKLDTAGLKRYSVPAPSLPFESYEERAAYLELVRIAGQHRKHLAALKETYDSLCGQLRMMAEDLNPEDLDDFIREFDLAGGSHAPL